LIGAFRLLKQALRKARRVALRFFAITTEKPQSRPTGRAGAAAAGSVAQQVSETRLVFS